MWEIWAEWENGDTECIDEADDTAEADYMVTEYTMAYGPATVCIWKQRA